jgi:uncharacterized protein (TIGR03437 family)
MQPTEESAMSISRLLTCIAIAAGLIPAFGATPSIQGVLNAGNYQSGIASAAWIAIFGTNLTTTTQSWGSSNFNGSNLPTKLGDVQVSINGIPAYVYFISPGQLDVLAPDDPATGQVMVVVTNSQGTSLPAPVNKQAAAPALFAYSQLGGRFGVIEEGLDNGLVAPPMLLGPTVLTHTASPGENIVLYGTGFGPVTPAQPTGQLVAAPAPTATPVTVTIGGQPATVQFAGLIESGLYQINVVVPVLPNGDAEIVMSVNGIQSQGSVFLPVQAYGDPSGQSAPTITNCVSGPVSSITYSTGKLSYGQADQANIGGTMVCASCSVKPPLYPEFAIRLERALERKETVSACYDSNGQIYQLKLMHQ